VVAGGTRARRTIQSCHVVNEYQLRNGNERRYTKEPRELGESEIPVLLRRARIGWDVTGETLCFVIRSNGRPHRAQG